MISKDIDLNGHCRPLRLSGQTNCVPNEAKNANGDEITSNAPIAIGLIDAFLAKVSFCNLQNRCSTEPPATDASTLSP